MKAALGKGWKWLLGLLMGLLGFTGCGKLGIFRAEYGCPNADFKLVGDVKDANGRGIEGIRVVFTPYPDAPEEQQKWDSDTLYSDAQGHFVKERLKHNWPDGAQKAAVKFEDVDGSTHGSFKTKVLTGSDFTVGQTKKGDKHWYSGEYTIQADAVLEEEE
ncbi:MAG: radical SAM-associated putative lipoprotein [Bacteroidales bacterium]|nr:radical SAM-associated putative lipoprotein [Bacteroidales bacterium]